MQNWIFLPTLLSCVFSSGLTSGMLGESLGVRRRGKAAQYWNITGSTHIRSTRDADDDNVARSFPIALPPGSLFSLFFEIAINVFNYNEEVSQNILLDFPITYVIPTPGFRSFSTSRGDLIGKLEEIGDRLGLDGNACTRRLLCEVAERPLKNAGLLGDIINLVLRGDPSDGNSRRHLRKSEDYIGAQSLGKAGNCTSLYKHCPVSLFNIPIFNK